MTKSMIVAYGKNREIGVAGDLPWGRGLPADLANFKRLTTGGSIIMGRKTFESIGNRPLPNRENIVLSKTPTEVKGALTALNLASAYALARYPIYVIGGATAYQAALSDVDTIYVTLVDATFPKADTFFPEINMDEWTEVSSSHHEADDRNLYAFDFIEYRRV